MCTESGNIDYVATCCDSFDMVSQAQFGLYDVCVNIMLCDLCLYGYMY